jgi:hypothetical protein
VIQQQVGVRIEPLLGAHVPVWCLDAWRPYLEDYEIRVLFRAVIDRKDQPLVAVDVDASREGPPRCVGVTVLLRPGEEEIQGAVSLPLEKLMRYAISAACRRVGHSGRDGEPVTDAMSKPRKRAARGRVTDDEFERAAKIYASALVEGRRDPVSCVAQTLRLSRSTAGRRIVEARRKGYLPATEPGRERRRASVA